MSFFITFINIFLEIYSLIILFSIFMSWFPNISPTFKGMIYQITYPFTSLFRFARFGMLDFSPVVAIIVLEILKGIIIRLLLGI